MKDTLCIVASHPLAQRFDFDRTDCDVWGFNEVLNNYAWYKRADAIFQLHLEPIWRNPKNRNDPNHANWLYNRTASCNGCEGSGCERCDNTGTFTPKKRDNVKIYMQEYYKDIPGCEAYPLEDIKGMLPHFEWNAANENTGKTYLTSSVSMALALGVFKGYKRIEVWGVEMNTDTEYRYQRDAVTFWEGVALGRGIEVLAMTDIYDAPVYGFEGEVTLPYETFAERMNALRPELEKRVNEFNASRAAFNAAVESLKIDFADYTEIIKATKAIATAAFSLHTIDGAMQENERYQQRADTMKAETDGVFQFSRQEFEQAMRDNDKIFAEREKVANAIGGACSQIIERIKQTKNKTKKRAVLSKFIEAVQQYISASSTVGLYAGARQENINYLQHLDRLVRAAGGVKSEEVLLNA